MIIVVVANDFTIKVDTCLKVSAVKKYILKRENLH